MQSPRLETIQVVQTDKWTGAASHKMKILADGNPDKFHCLAVFFFSRVPVIKIRRGHFFNVSVACVPEINVDGRAIWQWFAECFLMTRFRVLTAITDSAERRTTQCDVKATIRNGDGLILSSKTGVIDITQAPIIKGINSILLTVVSGFEKNTRFQRHLAVATSTESNKSKPFK